MGKKIKKVLITTGIITLLALGMSGCSKGQTVETSAPVQTEATTEADLDVRVNVPTTEVDIGDGPETAEVLETYSDGSYSGQLENGDTFTKLNLPTLSTGHQFTEEEAVELEIINSTWKKDTEENRSLLGREGLAELVSSLQGFSDIEVGEMVDFILAETPIPESQQKVKESEPVQTESKTQPESETTQPEPKKESKEVPKETQPQVTKPVVNETQPQIQPTQSQQQTESNTNGRPEGVSEQEWNDWLEFEKELKAGASEQKDNDVHIEHGGYDDTGEINIGG